MLLVLGSIATVLLVLAPLAAPARATPFQATLSLTVLSEIGSLGAVSFVASGSGTSTPALVTVPSGLFMGSVQIPVTGVASLSAISVQVSGNGAGNFHPFVPLRGIMPVLGALRFKGNLGGGPTTFANVPLYFTAHHSLSAVLERGLGRGGTFGSPNVSARFEGLWETPAQKVSSVPWGMTYSYHIAPGKMASHRSFFNYTVTTGSDARTPGGLGQVTLVSPIRIETSLAGTGSLLVVFGALTLNFVPEPGTLLLCGFGVAALAACGARSRRRL